MVSKSTNQAFWTAINPVPAQYPWLAENAECEVAVIGCGVTAALCAMRFAQAGYDTVMLGASPVGYGGTSVASGMLSIDGEQCLTTLVDKIGADRAMMAVQLLGESINNIEDLCDGFGDNCGFKRMDSLRFTSDKKSGELLRREYSLRLHNGIDVELLCSQSASDQFTFSMDTGIYSKSMGAQIDPYRFAHAVTAAAVQSGVRVYENTSVNVIDKSDTNCVKLECSFGRSLRAKYVIVAAGLETERQCGGISKTATMYTVVTKPISDFYGWRGPCMIRCEDSPRMFITVTPDQRILIGELGSPLMDERGYMAGILDFSSIMQKRYDLLEKKLRSMFPAIRGIAVEYMYASRTARTGDGLPIVGRLPEDSRVAYALCCGDDGLLYSEIASRLLLKQYQGETNREMGLFSPQREWRVKH